MTARGAISRRFSIVRAVQFRVAEFILLIGLTLVFDKVVGVFFWSLTLGLVIPTLFSEPYFTGPRIALATSVIRNESLLASENWTRA